MDNIHNNNKKVMLTCRFPKFKEIEYFKTKDTSTSGFGFKYGFQVRIKYQKKINASTIQGIQEFK